MLSILLFVLVILLQAADAYLTWRILRGGGRELNPVMRYLIARLGVVPGLALAKTLLAFLTGLFLFDSPALLFVVALLYLWVVLQNWEQLGKQLAKGGTA